MFFASACNRELFSALYVIVHYLESGFPLKAIYILLCHHGLHQCGLSSRAISNLVMVIVAGFLEFNLFHLVAFTLTTYTRSVITISARPG